MKPTRLTAAGSLLPGTAALLFCLTPLYAQISAVKAFTFKVPTTKAPTTRAHGYIGFPNNASSVNARQWEQALASQNGWMGVGYKPSGFFSSQLSGIQPWPGILDHYKIQDRGRPSFGPRHWIKSSGSWNLWFIYEYPGRPPASVYRMTYRIVCIAIGTGPIWTKTSGDGYYTAIGKVIRESGHYILRFSTAAGSAEVGQKSNFFGWSGTAEVQVIPSLPVADSHSAVPKR